MKNEAETNRETRDRWFAVSLSISESIVTLPNEPKRLLRRYPK